MSKIIGAAIYSLSNENEIAYEAMYNDGTRVRAILFDGDQTRKEYFRNYEWVPSVADKNYQHEKLIDEIEQFTRYQ